jgi:hypothetical protein
MHSLRTIQLHPLQESLGSIRETIETHSLNFSDFRLKHEITCTAYTKQMHNKKKTFMSITSIHREITQTMKLNQSFLLLIQYLYMGVLHTILYLLFSSECFDDVTMYKGGCLYLFSLLDFKAIKSRIKYSIYFTLTILNASST